MNDMLQWQEFKTADGKSYFFNILTKQTVWEWQEFKTPEGKSYYFNNLTKQTVWDKPKAIADLEGKYKLGGNQT